MNNQVASLTWLHISDIHFGGPDVSTWRDAALCALLKAIEREQEKGWHPDLIFFTGDVGFSGNSNQYKDARVFLDKLLDKTQLGSLKKQRVFIVPGNHDVDREEADKTTFSPNDKPHDDWVMELGRTSTKEDYRNTTDRIFKDMHCLKSLLRKFHGFQDFLNGYLGRTFAEDKPYIFSVVDNVNGFSVAILGFNTAWLAGKKEKEYRQLLGPLPLELAIQELKKASRVDLRFAMLHHPCEELHEYERDYVKDELRENVDFVLCGHVDFPQLADTPKMGSKVVPFLRVGPAFESSYFPNRFYLARYYTEHNKRVLTLNPFRYYHDSKSWLQDTEVLEKLRKFYGSEKLDLGPASPLSEKGIHPVQVETPLSPITLETLKAAEGQANKELERLERLKQAFGGSNNQYLQEYYARGLTGHLPDWLHLFLGELGASSRPEKEEQIFKDLDRNIRVLQETGNGILFHLISGRVLSGKSTMFKLVVRRLLEGKDLEQFPHVQKALRRLRIFEVPEKAKMVDWWAVLDALATELKHLASGESPLNIIYFDDLFDIDDEQVDEVMAALVKISEESPVYLISTCLTRQLAEVNIARYQAKFFMINGGVTPIDGLTPKDVVRLTDLAEKAHWENEGARASVLWMIKQGEAYGKVSLSIQHGLTYYQYVDRLFDNLRDQGETKNLVAFLLSSAFSRFSVHLPVTLIEELNKEIGERRDKLPDKADEYEIAASRGIDIFRIRSGNTQQGGRLPDTIAPFDDGIAEAAYRMWESREQRGERVPLFSCRLSELCNKAYKKLDESPSGRPLLAKIWSGMLLANSPEWNTFAVSYGPVKNGRWRFLTEPRAGHAWIAFSRLYTTRTRDMREYWGRVLTGAIQAFRGTVDEAAVRLTLCFLDPSQMQQDITWIHGLADLDESYFILFYEILSQTLEQRPVNVDFLSKYLIELQRWLGAHATNGGPITYRYELMGLVTKKFYYFRELRAEKRLNTALCGMIKDYLLNLENEYKTSSFLGRRALGRLAGTVSWPREDCEELARILHQYVEQQRNSLRPVVFERLLDFIRFGKLEQPSGERLFTLYVGICTQNLGFRGLTYTSQVFCDYLKGFNSIHPPEYLALLERIRDFLLTGELSSPSFRRSAAYPDLLEGFLEQLAYMRGELRGEELVVLLRPLVESFGDTLEVRNIFRRANERGLLCRDLGSVLSQVGDDVGKQIRLSLAAKANVLEDTAFEDFVSLTDAEHFTILNTIIENFGHYIMNREISSEIVSKYRPRIFGWLNQHLDHSYAPAIFQLLCLRPLFHSDLVNSKDAKAFSSLAIQLIRYHLRPGYFLTQQFEGNYLNKWFSDSQTDPECLHSLLDAYWQNILNNCHRTYKTQSQDKEKYSSYESFINLLDKFGIERDEFWWGKAVGKLVRYYADQLQKSLVHSIPKKTGVTRPMPDDTVEKLYDARSCLHLIMESLAAYYVYSSSRLRGVFVDSFVREVSNFADQYWTLPWRCVFEKEFTTDGTGQLIQHLERTDKQPGRFVNLYVRDHLDWWSIWVKMSKREVRGEIEAIWNWLDRPEPPNLAVVVIRYLMRVYPRHLTKLNVGDLVKKVLWITASDFGSKSYLVSGYLKWLLPDDEVTGSFSQENRDAAQAIANWLIREMENHAGSRSVVLGLQDVFQMSPQLEVKINFSKAERLFLSELESQIEYEPAGYLSKSYFSWTCQQGRDLKLANYLTWIENHFNAKQAPWVLARLVESFLDSSNPILRANAADLLWIWRTLRQFVLKRLEDEATTIAAEKFCNYLVHCWSSNSVEKDKLGEIAADLYLVCQQKVAHPRIVYCLIGVLPLWQKSAERPVPRHVLALWQGLKLRSYENKSFNMLAEAFNNYFLEQESQIRAEFWRSLLNYAKENPHSPLSPTFMKLLLLAQLQLQKEEVSVLVGHLFKSQENLEDVSYVVGEYLRGFLPNMAEDERLTEERALIAQLSKNLYKRFAGECLYRIVENCDLTAHWGDLAAVVESYLRRTRDYSQVPGILFLYEKRKESIQASDYVSVLQRFVSAIQMNLQETLLDWDVSRWEDLSKRLRPLRKVQRQQGNNTYLFPTVSLEEVLNRLENYGAIGLIMTKREITVNLSP